MDQNGRNTEGLTLYVADRQHIDQAWRDGAKLMMPCVEDEASECTSSQLKNRLARGELVLLAIQNENFKGAWMAVEFIQLPNMHVMEIYAFHDPDNYLDKAFDLLCSFAKKGGASAIQGTCNEAGMASWCTRFGFNETYRMARRVL